MRNDMAGTSTTVTSFADGLYRSGRCFIRSTFAPVLPVEVASPFVIGSLSLRFPCGGWLHATAYRNGRGALSGVPRLPLRAWRQQQVRRSHRAYTPQGVVE